MYLEVILSQIVLSSTQNPNDPTILANRRRVVYVEGLFDVISEDHCRQKGHVGSKKRYLYI